MYFPGKNKNLAKCYDIADMLVSFATRKRGIHDVTGDGTPPLLWRHSGSSEPYFGANNVHKIKCILWFVREIYRNSYNIPIHIKYTYDQKYL